MTSQVALASSNATDVITGNSIAFTQAGARTITATLHGTITATATVTVTAAAPTKISLRLDDTTVNQGDTVPAEVTGTDRYGNSTGDLTGQAVLSSDHDTDAITGNSIHFSHASTHVITATLSTGPAALTSSVSVTVTPAADAPAAAAQTGEVLPVTGYTATPAPLIALLLVLLGAGIIIVAGRRRTA